MNRPALSLLRSVSTLLLVWSAQAAAQRPDEAELFGAPAEAPESAASSADAGTPDRPPESELFGGQATPEPSARPIEEQITGGQGTGPEDRTRAPDQIQPHGSGDEAAIDAARLGGPDSRSAFETEEAKEDPLKIGGTLYLRTVTDVQQNDQFENVTFSVPSLMDAYFDARPNDRVRGMLLARLNYDPVYDPNDPEFPFLALPPRPNPSVALDQLWIRFDIARTVFVTAGKQHVKWGASRFWNPTDFLSPSFKDPLAVFDVRLGANMLKLHIPWEAKGWNFYAIGLLDNAGPANKLGELGGALRAEIVLGGAELGADAVYVRGSRPRYGLDLSTALGPIDLYGEVAFRDGADFRQWRLIDGTINVNKRIEESFEAFNLRGLITQVSGGVTFTFNYTENNALTLGAEYFHNPAGLDDPTFYPWLLSQGEFNAFYVGRHYAAIYAMAMGLPGGFDDITLILSNLGNLSDKSFTSRLDAIFRVLSYLSVETCVSTNYGTTGGSFRFAVDLPPLPAGEGKLSDPIFFPPTVLQLGVGLRVSL
jgi:hypothetical protein